MLLEGSVALVTGGASGLGRGTSEFLSARGARIAVVDLERSAGAEVAKELPAEGEFFACDITSTDSTEATVQAVVERFGKIDLAVNCAGGGGYGMRMIAKDGTPHSMDHFTNVVNLNLIGTFDMIRRQAVAMSRNEPGDSGERGLIVNTASIAGLEGQIGQMAYAAAKAALIGLTLPLARDLSSQGIRVLTVAPGMMDTPALDGVDENVMDALRKVHLFPQRMGTPEDFGRLVAALAENVLLNGEVIRLDAATRLGPR